MKAKRTILIGGLAVTLAGGGAALAARDGDDGDKAEQAILSDAAERLGVSAEELEDALAKAEDAQLDKAVKDGDLTQKQADAIRKRRQESGRVLGVPGEPGFHRHGFRGPGFGFAGPGPLRFVGPGGVIDAVADALGISVEDLLSELRDGKSLEQVAKAHDKSLDDVEKVAKEALEKRLDAAVEDGDLTKSQAEQIRKRLPDLIEHLGDRPPRLHRHFGPQSGEREGFGPPPPWR